MGWHRVPLQLCMSMMGNRWHLRRSPFILPFNLGPLSRSLEQFDRLESSISAPRSAPNPIFCTSKSCHRLRSLGYRAYPTLYFGPEKSHKINRFDSIIQFGLSSFALLSEIMSWIMTIDQLCTSYHICQSYQGYQYFLNSYPKHYWNDWRTHDYSKCLFQDEFVAAGFFNIRRRIWSCLTI